MPDFRNWLTPRVSLPSLPPPAWVRDGFSRRPAARPMRVLDGVSPRPSILHRYGSIQPVLNAQFRHLLEVAHVAREERGVMREGDARNPEIHGADATADGAKPLESFRAFAGPRQDGPAFKKTKAG